MHPEPSPLHRLFLNREGLRPGWGIALFCSVPVTLTVFVKLLAHYYPLVVQQPKGAFELTPLLSIVTEGALFAFFAFVAFLISLLEKRPFASYGLARRKALPDFATGLAWGFTMLSTLIAAMHGTHSIAFSGLALHGLPIVTYALSWAVAFLCVALFEEFGFRGYLQATLTRAFEAFLPYPAAFALAALFLSAGVFAWTHTGNGGETPWGIAAVALAGLTFVFSLYRTGTLWWAIGFHAAWDWAQSFFYGTPDSGNLARGHLFNTHPTGSALLSGASAGPEGSVLVLPTLLLTCLIIHLTLPRRSDDALPEAAPIPPIYTNS